MDEERTTLPSFAPVPAGARVPTRVRSTHGALTAVEIAVLSCIDGKRNVAWIAGATALGVPEVTAIVRTLEHEGIVRFVDVVALEEQEEEDSDLEELDPAERVTLPNPAHDRPTRPG